MANQKKIDIPTLYDNVPRASGVYSITNISNNKRYIGYSKDMHRRLNEHQLGLTYHKHYCSSLQEDWNTQKDKFIFEVIEITDDKSREEYWILEFKSNDLGYNNFLGNRPTEEAKKKISTANSGRVRSEETKQKLRDANLGKVMDEETKKKISESNKGKKLSEETKNKISISKKGIDPRIYYKSNKKEIS